MVVGRILVVDDELTTLQTLEAILHRGGFSTACVSSLDAAREALARESFDLLLTDLYLGGDDLGSELAELARDRWPEVPVVLLTGRPSLGGMLEAVRSAVREIVVKPVDPERLLQVCERTIEASRIERRARYHAAQNRVLSAVVPMIIEAKDPTTSGHSERVVRYVDRLAVRCGVSDEDREQLRLAAMLHDVGKIAVPRAILCKEGPLTAAEREVIERHPQDGFDILRGLEDCEQAREWVYQHHERWDGRGYPNRLQGCDVALPGRILSLAEVYDALAERRSYKEPWSNERIVALFRKEAGHHFDPDLAHLVADGLEREGRRFFAPTPELLF